MPQPQKTCLITCLCLDLKTKAATAAQDLRNGEYSNATKSIAEHWTMTLCRHNQPKSRYGGKKDEIAELTNTAATLEPDRSKLLSGPEEQNPFRGEETDGSSADVLVSEPSL